MASYAGVAHDVFACFRTDGGYAPTAITLDRSAVPASTRTQDWRRLRARDLLVAKTVTEVPAFT